MINHDFLTILSNDGFLELWQLWINGLHGAMAPRWTPWSLRMWDSWTGPLSGRWHQVDVAWWTQWTFFSGKIWGKQCHTSHSAMVDVKTGMVDPVAWYVSTNNGVHHHPRAMVFWKTQVAGLQWQVHWELCQQPSDPWVPEALHDEQEMRKHKKERHVSNSKSYNFRCRSWDLLLRVPLLLSSWAQTLPYPLTISRQFNITIEHCHL